MELHRLAHQFLCADEDVDLTLFQVLQQLCRLFGRSCSRQVVNAHRHVFQAAGESAEMLEGQYRRGDEHGHLLAVDSSLEGCTHGNFGLAEAHITAYQTVHGLAHLHVGLHILRGFQLVGRVLVEERGFQFVLQIAIVAEGEAALPAS